MHCFSPFKMGECGVQRKITIDSEAMMGLPKKHEVPAPSLRASDSPLCSASTAEREVVAAARQGREEEGGAGVGSLLPDVPHRDPGDRLLDRGEDQTAAPDRGTRLRSGTYYSFLFFSLSG